MRDTQKGSQDKYLKNKNLSYIEKKIKKNKTTLKIRSMVEYYFQEVK